MRPYLGPPWTNSCQIWCVRVFHHVLLKYGHENAEMQKKKIWWCHTSVLYRHSQSIMSSSYVFSPVCSTSLSCTAHKIYQWHDSRHFILYSFLQVFQNNTQNRVFCLFVCLFFLRISYCAAFSDESLEYYWHFNPYPNTSTQIKKKSLIQTYTSIYVCIHS